MKPAQPVETTYQATGVDAERAQTALARLTERIKTTWPSGGGTGSVKLDLRYFTNVLQDREGRGPVIPTAVNQLPMTSAHTTLHQIVAT
ncbi:MAG: hypothetical protein IIA00_09320 [Proteobacteria bacterium]|nr:hypothetical protein [Pseudomonadota bacterium]